MFKLGKSKSTNTTPIKASDAAAAAMIASPENAGELRGSLQTSLESMSEGGPRARLVKRQLEQVEIACEKHLLNAERKRVNEAIGRDRTAAQEALAKATSDLAQSNESLSSERTRLTVVVDRLTPLEQELEQILAASQAQVDAAQIAFDEAIASGDKDGEEQAAQRLFTAKRARDGGDALAGSIELRLQARRVEKLTAEAAMVDAEKRVDDAAERCRQARALALIVEYDATVHSMIEAFIAQRAAVDECKSKAALNGRGIDAPEVQIGSVGRVIFGPQMTDYNNRHVPAYNLTRMVKAVLAEPDLQVLAMDPWSIPEAAPADPQAAHAREAEEATAGPEIYR